MDVRTWLMVDCLDLWGIFDVETWELEVSGSMLGV